MVLSLKRFHEQRLKITETLLKLVLGECSGLPVIKGVKEHTHTDGGLKGSNVCVELWKA